MRSAAILFILSLSVTLFASDYSDLSALRGMAALSLQNQRYEFGTGFVHPNERNPKRMQSAFTEVPIEGAYVGVGTERTFIAVALNPQINLVVQVDRDPKVVMFNRINTMLLTIADNLDDYQKLRFESTTQVVSFKLRQFFKSEVVSEAHLYWFLKTVRENKGFEAFGHKKALSPFASSYFRGARYTHDRVLFQRLKRLARDGRILSLLGNLSDETFVRSLNHSLVQAKTKISILDVSNAWWPQYTGSDGLRKMLEAFQTSVVESSQVLMTNGGGLSAKNWDYLAIPIQKMISFTEPLGQKIIQLFEESTNSCRSRF